MQKKSYKTARNVIEIQKKKEKKCIKNASNVH